MCEKEIKSTEEAIEKKAIYEENKAAEEMVTDEVQSTADSTPDITEIS